MVSRRMPVIRRILCTLLVCALLTGLLPAAFAAGSDPDFSAPAERLWAHLDDFVNSFSDPDLDYTEAEEDIRNFLVRGGFALFNDEAPGRQEIFVIPKGGFAPIDDPTV